jgi:hypothetical protein
MKAVSLEFSLVDPKVGMLVEHWVVEKVSKLVELQAAGWVYWKADCLDALWDWLLAVLKVDSLD